MRKCPWVVLALVAVGVALAVPACTSDQIAEAKVQKGRAEAVLVATTQAVADLEEELAALPPDDPARTKIEQAVQKGRQVIAAAQKTIDVADGAIRSAEKGEVDPSLREALREVPYGPLALAAMSVGFGLWRMMKQKRSDHTLERVVDSWQQAINPLTEEEKVKVKTIQGEAATRHVSDIRMRLSPTP